jgi:hypothetical protein
MSKTPLFNRMNDGRMFTDWTPHGSVTLIDNADAISANEAKQRITDNALEIMQKNHIMAAKTAGLAPDGVAHAIDDIPGYELHQTCDRNSCFYYGNAPVPGNDGTGVGTERTNTGGARGATS